MVGGLGFVGDVFVYFSRFILLVFVGLFGFFLGFRFLLTLVVYLVVKFIFLGVFFCLFCYGYDFCVISSKIFRFFGFSVFIGIMGVVELWD